MSALQTTRRAILRTAAVLMAAAVVVAAAIAIAPPYDPKAAEAAQARAIAERSKGHTPTPGSEDALRQSIADIRSGRPDYAHMSKSLSDAVRRDLPRSQQMLENLGALQAVDYQGGFAGNDFYRLTFANGALLAGTSVDKNGVIKGLFYRRPGALSPQDWIENYANFTPGDRMTRMATQVALLIAFAAFGRLALRIRL